MQQIIYFIQKFRYFLLFLFLEFLAFYFIVQHHSYHNSKFVNSANAISGNLFERMNNLSEFVNLKEENQLLVEQNSKLLNLLESTAVINSAEVLVNDAIYKQKYTYRPAKIINNNYTGKNNFLTINRGAKDSIYQDMGVINSKGIVGVIKNTSTNYATVLSILSGFSKINIRLKDSDHFGTLIWDGKDYNILQITDIPRQALIKEGDTIITGGKSAIFPEGIPVGVIVDSKFTNNRYELINVKLFNDMSSLGYVQVVQNLQKEEQHTLEQADKNE